MSGADALLVEREGAVVRLTFNRPESGNALSQDLTAALVSEAIRCDNDASVRCVVLTGAGRAFCSGGDIGVLSAASGSVGDVVSHGASTLHLAMSKLARMRKPLLVLVNGPAAGAGMSLALCGDIVIAAESAHFTAGYTAIGMTPDGGLTWLLPKLVGLRRAQDIILTNRRINAAEAAATGMITRVVSDDALAAEGARVAMALAEGATEACGSVRSLLLDGFCNGYETQIELEARAITRAASSSEAREGFAAFFERRKPSFSTASD